MFLGRSGHLNCLNMFNMHVFYGFKLAPWQFVMFNHPTFLRKQNLRLNISMLPNPHVLLQNLPILEKKLEGPDTRAK